MNRRKTLTISLAISLLLLAFNLRTTYSQQTERSQSAPDNSQTGTITGRVTGEQGQPLPGAAISIQAIKFSLQQRNATSDNDGNFQFTNLDQGLYKIFAYAPAYTLPPREPDTPVPYYRIGDNVRLELVRGGIITGTVTNAAGEPIVGIRVKAAMVRDLNDGSPVEPFFRMQEKLTDDRGIYRIYGLAPGTYVVSAGGASQNQYELTPYELDAPTYAPSGTRDNAAEVVIRSGEERNIDIRYRSESGHTVSGRVKLNSTAGATVTLLPPSGELGSAITTYIGNDGPGFAILGVPDGDYTISAQEALTQSPGSVTFAISEPMRVAVRGADVTGIELTPKPLGSVTGRLSLTSSTAAECQGKRKPLLSETIIEIKRNASKNDTDELSYLRYLTPPSVPDKDGNFELRNLRVGQYVFTPRFFARYWYLQSITLPAPSTKSTTANANTDAGRNWITVKTGERVAGLTLTLAEGAASIRGKVGLAEGTQTPERLSVYVVPAEREKTDDVFRYFVSRVEPDGTFALNNIAPGRYWTITQVSDVPELSRDNFRLPSSAEVRTKIRRAAELATKEISLKPCEDLKDFVLPLK